MTGTGAVTPRGDWSSVEAYSPGAQIQSISVVKTMAKFSTILYQTCQGRLSDHLQNSTCGGTFRAPNVTNRTNFEIYTGDALSMPVNVGNA